VGTREGRAGGTLDRHLQGCLSAPQHASPRPVSSLMLNSGDKLSTLQVKAGVTCVAELICLIYSDKTAHYILCVPRACFRGLIERRTCAEDGPSRSFNKGTQSRYDAFLQHHTHACNHYTG
jgi:hypothetical protein